MLSIIQISHSLLIIAAFLSILAGYRYFQYRTPTARWGGLYLFSLALEIVSFALLLVSQGSSYSIFLYIIQVTSFYFLITFWLFFIAETAGYLKTFASRTLLVFLSIPPAVQAILIYQFAEHPSQGMPISEFFGSLSKIPLILGVFGSFMVILFFAMGTLSLILLAWLSIKSNRIFRKLFVPMMMGNILIFVLDFVDRSGFTLFESSYLIQYGLALMGVLVFVYAYAWRFGGILPISRESVFAGTHDGVIILDYYDRIVDINELAQKYLGLEKKKAVNKKISLIWAFGSNLLNEFPDELLTERECVLEVDGQSQIFSVVVYKNPGLNNSPNGRLILLRNVAKCGDIEEDLDERSRELQRTNALMETLTAISVNVKQNGDQYNENEIARDKLNKLGLVYFVAEYDPQACELVLIYLSALPEKIKKVEKMVRGKLTGFRLDRSQFSIVYNLFESKEILFDEFEKIKTGRNSEKIPIKILDQAISLVGPQPHSKILVLPLVAGEQSLGIMGIWGVDLRESDKAIFQIFASQIAQQMEQAALHKATEQQAAELVRSNNLVIALSNVTSILGATPTSETLLDVLGTELKKVNLDCAIVSFSLDYESANIKYLSIGQETIKKFFRLSGIRLDKLSISKRFWPDARLISEQVPIWYDNVNIVMKTLFPQIREDIQEKIANLLFGGNENNLYVEPLFSGDEISGALAIWGADLQTSDSPILSVFGHQVAGILRNLANLENEVQRSEELARSNKMILSMSNVASQLDAASDVPQVFSILGDELRKIGLKCMIGILDHEKENLRVEYISIIADLKKWSRRLGSIWPDDIVIPRRLWPTEKVTDEKVPFWDTEPVTNIGRMFPGIPRVIFEKAFDMSGLKLKDNVCYLPVISEDNPIGIFAVWGENLHKEDIHVLTVLSSQVAGIIRRLNSLEDEVMRSKRLMHNNAMVIALSNVAAQLDTTTDLDRIFATLGTELQKAHIHCMVGTLDESKQSMKIEYLSDMANLINMSRKLKFFSPEEVVIPRRLWPSVNVITEKTPYWDPNPVGNIHKMLPFIPKNIFFKVISKAGINPSDPICYLPMIIEEDVIGILAVWGTELNPEDLIGFSVFANQLATAVKTSRLYALAQNEITERTQAEKQIRLALEEKEILLKEIHHRVKNNLQIIMSLLNLQAAEISDERTLEALRESRNRLRSMALIHEKLYQSKDLARIDFAGYLDSLVSSLSQTYRVKSEKVTFRMQSEPVTFDIDLAIPCGLIITELISNSLKYAFPGDRKGLIDVILVREKGNKWALTVSDDGVGLPEGLEIGESPSLGLKLVSNLVRQINGQIEIDRARGTEYRIFFEI